MKTPPPPPTPPRNPPHTQTLLILPCNPCVRLGNYMLCSNWRIIWRDIWDLYLSGKLYLAAIDSCKPGIVLWGEEHRLTHCDIQPSSTLYYKREPWRLDILKQAVLQDTRNLLTAYQHIIYYVNVKAYREALDHTAKKLPNLKSASPPMNTIPSYRSRRNREKLRQLLENPAHNPDYLE